MQEIKSFQMRLPRDLWLFLKKVSAENDTSMMDIFITCLEKYKKSYEKKLTLSDPNV